MAAKKPNFREMVDHTTDPKEKSAFFSESEDDHKKRMKTKSEIKKEDTDDTDKQQEKLQKEKLTKRANFLLKPSTHARFKKYTQDHFLTMNAVVNELIENYLREHNG